MGEAPTQIAEAQEVVGLVKLDMTEKAQQRGLEVTGLPPP